MISACKAQSLSVVWKRLFCNKQDILTAPLLAEQPLFRAFTTKSPDLKELVCLKMRWSMVCVAVSSDLFNVSNCPKQVRIISANVRQALAMLELLGVDGLCRMRLGIVLKEFGGFAYRCETVRNLHKCYVYNDSKGTNVGRYIWAALQGLGFGGKKELFFLIAGGRWQGAWL